MGEPIFTVQTAVSEENYRRAVSDELRNSRFLIFLVFLILLYLYKDFFSEISDMSFLSIVVNISMFILAVTFGIHTMMKLKKSEDINIAAIVFASGETTLRMTYYFYETEVYFSNVDFTKDFHVSYVFIHHIEEYDEFYKFKASGVWFTIAKKDLPDPDGFIRFLTAKNPEIRLVHIKSRKKSTRLLSDECRPAGADEVPLFSISTKLNEKMYRKGLGASADKYPSYLWIAISAVNILIMSRDVLFFRLDMDSLTTHAILLIVYIIIMVKCIRDPIKIKNNAILELYRYTGKTDIFQTFDFFDSEIQFISFRTNKIGHFPYAYVKEIYEFGDFIMLNSRLGKAVYIAKADISDHVQFMSFLSAKCPAAKHKIKK